MAFGSWFKNIIKGAKNIIGKVIPTVKKGIDTIGKLAPAIATGAAAFGGPIGSTISNVANTVGNVANGFNKLLSTNGSGIQKLPVNGANRFAIPLLKNGL